MDKKYEAKVACNYVDDGEKMTVDFTYGDSNGIHHHKVYTATDDPSELTNQILNDILARMMQARNKPENMSREELIDELQKARKEANEQRAKNAMLEKRLAAKAPKPEQPKRQEKPKERSNGEKSSCHHIIRIPIDMIPVDMDDVDYVGHIIDKYFSSEE